MDRPPSDLFTSSSPVGDGQADRRRDSLFLMARLRGPALPQTYSVRIRNLSAGGLMADFAEPVDRDMPIEVEVRGIGWVPGRIAWFAEGRTGIAFDRPIDPQRARKPVGRGGRPG